MNDNDQEGYYEEYHQDSEAKRARINAAAKVFATGDSIRRLNEKNVQSPAAELNIKSQGTNPLGKPINPRKGFDLSHEVFREYYDNAIGAYEAARPLNDDLRNDFLMNNQSFHDDLAATIPPARSMIYILETHTHRGSHTRRELIRDMQEYIDAVEACLGLESHQAIRGMDR